MTWANLLRGSGSEPVAIHDHSYAFRHSLNPTYVSYCMQTAAFRAAEGPTHRSDQGQDATDRRLRQDSDPGAELKEQERIVEILDTFDALVNDLSIGLPAELAARRKQYEYYRDKLLTFEEAA